MRFLVCLFATVLLFAAVATADEIEVRPYEVDGGCALYRLCDDQVGTGVCGGSGSERFIRTKGFSRFIFMADTSDALGEAFTIKIYSTTPGQGYSPNRALVNDATIGDITPSTPVFVWQSTLGDIHAEISGTNTEGVNLIGKFCQ